MQKKYPWLAATGCALVLLVCTFRFWPILGHDYALIVPSLIDLKVAFAEHGVLNPHFSPMKCLGTPLWANPVSFNLSLLHLFTILSSDLFGLGFFIVFVSLTSFYGAYRLSRLLEVSEPWSLYLGTAWTLQGWMVIRSVVGHTTYISLGWFPLILYLFLKKRSFYRDVIACLVASFLLSQYVFLAAPYNPFFLVFSFLFLLPVLFVWNMGQLLDWKNLLWKITLTSVVTINLLYSKLSAVRDLMSAYPRQQSLMKVGLAALPYPIMNLFSFLPHDFKGLVEWWYGNWESTQYLFPVFLLSSIFMLRRSKQEKTLVKLLATVLYFVGISFVFCSGLLAGVFSKVPLLSAMHVNPRWNIITAIPLFFLVCFLLRPNTLFNRRWLVAFMTLAILTPFIHLRPANLGINYSYRTGYDSGTNRLTYCYEPFLGYKLEFFPLMPTDGQIHFISDPLLDPRCYLPSRQCSPGTPLSRDGKKLLESYELE